MELFLVIWLTIALLYISVYAGLLMRGDASKEVSPSFPNGRPALFYSPMIYRKSKSLIYLRDQIAYALVLTPFVSIPFLYYFEKPLWLAIPYAIGVCLGGLRGWGDVFDMGDETDYKRFFVRLLDYSVLFIGLGYCSYYTGNESGVFVGIISTLIFAAVAPMLYHLRNSKRVRSWTDYPSQFFAEAPAVALYTMLAAWVVL